MKKIIILAENNFAMKIVRPHIVLKEQKDIMKISEKKTL